MNGAKNVKSRDFYYESPSIAADREVDGVLAGLRALKRRGKKR